MKGRTNSPTEASIGIRRVNWGLVLARATALAASHGREAHEVSREDWDEATAAITGQTDVRSGILGVGVRAAVDSEGSSCTGPREVHPPGEG
jgi:hypothetical protein